MVSCKDWSPVYACRHWKGMRRKAQGLISHHPRQPVWQLQPSKPPQQSFYAPAEPTTQHTEEPTL